MIGGIWLNEAKIRGLVGNGEIDRADSIMKRVVTDACDNSAKRLRAGTSGRNKAYWWSAEIADLRGKCSMWRRRLVRAKRRGTPETAEQMAGALREGRKKLKKAIGTAKRKAWEELLEGLNADP